VDAMRVRIGADSVAERTWSADRGGGGVHPLEKTATDGGHVRAV